jgi:CheY-like chemotaxis protein
MQASAGQQSQEGTGLGLTLSRSFVHLMGGEIRIDSIPGRGTTVSFDIPVRIEVEEAAPAVKERPRRQVVALAPGEPRYRILVADDRKDARCLLSRLLGPLGFEVREAANGQQAVQIWEAWRPHMIWMDMRMPVMDGRTATQRIKASAGGQGTVVIALTASSFEEERADILAAGSDDYLRKPFEEDELFGLMQKHLGARFIYRDDAAPSVPHEETEEIIPAALPDALRAMLEDALIRLDSEAVDNAIAQVQDVPMARALGTLAGEFQYGRMLELIRGIAVKGRT